MIALTGKPYQLMYSLSVGASVGLFIAAAVYLSIVLLTLGWVSTCLIAIQVIKGKYVREALGRTKSLDV